MNKQLVEMIDKKIFYRKGFKYQSNRDFSILTNTRPSQDIHVDFIDLFTTGLLCIKRGYAWDGPSGPAFDTPTFMKASKVHDAFYQLMRMGLLSQSRREFVDELMYEICLADGMWKVRAWWCVRGVNKFAASSADPKNIRPTLTAP